MAEGKSGHVTWWKHLLHKLDPNGSNSNCSNNGGQLSPDPSTAIIGSVTSSVEAFEGSSSSGSLIHCPHHNETKRNKIPDSCQCSTCPCINHDTFGTSKGDPSVVDMIRSLDAFADKSIIDPSQDHWIESLHKLMNDFFLNTSSTNVRLRALEILSMCLHNFSYIHEDLVIENVVIKYLGNIHLDTDVEVRQRVVQVVIQLLLESRPKNSSKYLNLFDILSLILNRPFKCHDTKVSSNVSNSQNQNSSGSMNSSSFEKLESSTNSNDSTSGATVIINNGRSQTNGEIIKGEEELADILTTLTGLETLFRKHILKSCPLVSMTAFKLMIDHLRAQYLGEPIINFNKYDAIIKKKIVTFLLSIRANDLGQIGVIDTTTYSNDCINVEDMIEFSPFVTVFHCGNEKFTVCNAIGCPGNHTMFDVCRVPRSGLARSPPPVKQDHKVRTNWPIYDPWLLANHSANVLQGILPPQRFDKGTKVNFPMNDLYHSVILCFEMEANFTIIDTLLPLLKNFIQRNSIIVMNTPSFVAAHRTIADDLVAMATKLLNGVDKFDTMAKVEGTKKLTKTECQAKVYPLLESLVVYGRHLEPARQKELILALKTGLQNRSCHRSIILALTCCMMEMEDAMAKLLPDLLIKISQISATKSVALPKMDFLSNLVLFPRLYSSFTSDQYMTIFAIICPYSNLSEFSDFTVALAHRVLAIWFLSCKLDLRKRFVSYIRKNLEQTLTRTHHPSGNGNDEFRFRSSSLNQRDNNTHVKRTPGVIESSTTSSRHPPTPTHHNHPSLFNFSPHNVQPIPSSPTITTTTLGPMTPNSFSSALTSAFSFASLGGSSSTTTIVNSSTTSTAHNTPATTPGGNNLNYNQANTSQLLFEACMEMLSRYTYGMTSSTPAPNPFTSFLFEKSQSQSWIIGKELITITTSHCSSRAYCDGLCKSCYTQCKCANEDARAESSSQTTPPKDRKSSMAEEDETHPAPDFPYESREAFEARRKERRKERERPPLKVGDVYPHDQDLSTTDEYTKSIFARQLIGPYGKCYSNTSPETDAQREEFSYYYHLKDQKSRKHFEEQEERKRHRSAAPSVILSQAIPKPAKAVDEYNYPESKGFFGHPSWGMAYPHPPALSEPPNTNNNTSTNCSCWCQGWAEITIRKTTGKTSFVLRIENTLNMPCLTSCPEEMPFPDFLHLYNPPTIPSGGANGATNGNGGKADKKSMKRVTSSPDMEQVAVPQGGQLEEGIDVAAEASTIDTNTETSARAKSVGKNSRETSPPSFTPTTVKRTASFTSSTVRKPLSPTKVSNRKQAFDDTSMVKLRNLSEQTRHGDMTQNSDYFKASRLGDLAFYDIFSESAKRERSKTLGMDPRAYIRHLRPRRPISYESTKEEKNSTLHTKSTGLNPSFVFLQFFYSSTFKNPGNNCETPILLPSNDNTDRAIRILDLITPYETHKIGIVYVAKGQAKGDKSEILSNAHGSVRYQAMLQKMGNLMRLKDIDQSTCFLGGLSQDGSDGKFTYCWTDNLTQVVFHVATLMPTRADSDPNCNGKIRHIGNDDVCIIYNDSGKQSFDKNILTGGKSAYLKVCIVITPLDCDLNLVQIHSDEEMVKMLDSNDPQMITDKHLPLFVRQTAIHANLACEVFKRRSATDPFISNWVERLKHLNRLKEKNLAMIGNTSGIMRSHSVDPTKVPNVEPSSVIASPGSMSVSSVVSSVVGGNGRNASGSESINNRPRSTTISNINKQLYEGGMTLTEPMAIIPDHEHPLAAASIKSKVADDFTFYT